MKILYGIQGTGHGHISRAREIIPELSKHAEIEILISGYNCKMSLENVSVTKKRGISLAYNSKGSVSILKTALSIHPITFIRDIRSLDIKKYDLVISDYEPVTAWAAVQSGVPSVALSHQASFLSDKSPRPKVKSLFAEQVLKHFAPCDMPVGFHFKRYDHFIHPPIIRSEVQQLTPFNNGHISVYLPAYHHNMLIRTFNYFDDTDWHIFSPECSQTIHHKNVTVNPVGNKPFLKSLESSCGVVTSAGFETCAEAMYLNKKLLVVPIQNQYEQHCNAAALEEIGITIANNADSGLLPILRRWLWDAPVISLPEIADTSYLRQFLLQMADEQIEDTPGKLEENKIVA